MNDDAHRSTAGFEDEGLESTQTERGDVTAVLAAWSRGDTGALEKLMPMTYAELRQIARVHLARERQDHTLQPTALVHEAFLRLASLDHIAWGGRAHFLAFASRIMRRVLTDLGRRRSALKRDGGDRVPLEGIEVIVDSDHLDMVELDQLLERLCELDPRLVRIVKMRVFGGLTVAEMAEVEQVSPTTIKRDWRMARAWLHDALSSSEP